MNNTNIIKTRKLMTIVLIGSFVFFSSSCNKKAETNEENEVFTIVEELPLPEGGMDSFYNFVQKEITYPLMARENGIEGSVMVEFVVKRDGSLADFRVARGIGNGCDSEVMRVIKTASPFNPGKQRGRTVKVGMMLPITFKLDPDNTNADESPKGMVIVEEIMFRYEEMTIDASYADGVWSGAISYDNEPLPGASIVVKGTTSGTVSDLDGSFTIKAEKSQELAVSFVGYKTELIKLQ